MNFFIGEMRAYTAPHARYQRRPAHFFGGLGLLVGTVGIGILLYLSIGWFMGIKGIGTRPLFFFGILGTLLSAQLISLGLIAELVLVRTLRLEPAVAVAERVDTSIRQNPD